MIYNTIIGGVYFREDVLGCYPHIIAGLMVLCIPLVIYKKSKSLFKAFVPLFVIFFFIYTLLFVAGSMCPHYSQHAFTFGGSIGCCITLGFYFNETRNSKSPNISLSLCTILLILMGIRVPFDISRALNGGFQTRAEFMQQVIEADHVNEVDIIDKKIDDVNEVDNIDKKVQEQE